jgi:hypothetical protein
MNRLLAATLLIIAASGCAATPHPERTAPSAPAPAIGRACDAARKVINDRTAEFTAEMDAAVTAGERGDPRAQKRAMANIRATFKQWAGDLRAQAGGVGDAQLKAVLIEYGGAVDATIARVRTAADLESLVSFDNRELDVMANRFHDVCH